MLFVPGLKQPTVIKSEGADLLREQVPRAFGSLEETNSKVLIGRKEKVICWLIVMS